MFFLAGAAASNALDFALLVQGLVELLKAYGCALQSGDERVRLDMAGAICQGISADPELFLNRVGLLRAYSMIEHVFIATDPVHHPARNLGGWRFESAGSIERRLVSADLGDGAGAEGVDPEDPIQLSLRELRKVGITKHARSMKQTDSI